MSSAISWWRLLRVLHMEDESNGTLTQFKPFSSLNNISKYYDLHCPRSQQWAD